MGEREEDWTRIQSPRERSIRRATREGRLVPARDLIHELNLIVHLDTAVMVELIGGQYQLAERRGINSWIRDLHYQGTFLMPLRELQWYFPKLETHPRRESREEKKDWQKETYPRRESREGGKDRRRETHPKRESREEKKDWQRETQPRRESREGGKDRRRETHPRRESREEKEDRQRETRPRRESREEEKVKENPRLKTTDQNRGSQRKDSRDERKKASSGPTELQKSQTKPRERSQDRWSHSYTARDEAKVARGTQNTGKQAVYRNPDSK